MMSGAILIAGPTASGKSALAIALARELGGAVVNADSMQVYRDLRILTARPTIADEAATPHFLYGHVDGAEAYSVGAYARDVQALLPTLRERGLTPIFVGGTGLYFSALTEGLSPIPQIDPTIRAHWREQARTLGASALHQTLQRLDPAMAARLSPSDPQRLARALEVLQSTGRSLAEWQAVPGQPILPTGTWRGFVLQWPRADLYARADSRFHQMVQSGALDEVDTLVKRGLAGDLPVMRALGVQPLTEYMKGTCDLADAIARGQQQTRNYIKRQETWISGKMKTFFSLNISENFSTRGQIGTILRLRIDDGASLS